MWIFLPIKYLKYLNGAANLLLNGRNTKKRNIYIDICTFTNLQSACLLKDDATREYVLNYVQEARSLSRSGSKQNFKAWSF